MHTTRCIAIHYATPQDHREGNHLPYRLLIILSPILLPRSLSQRSRRNQVLRQHGWSDIFLKIFISNLLRVETQEGCGTIKANKETHMAPQLG